MTTEPQPSTSAGLSGERTYPKSSGRARHFWPFTDMELHPWVVCEQPALNVSLTVMKERVTCRACLRWIDRYGFDRPAPRVIPRSNEVPF